MVIAMFLWTIFLTVVCALVVRKSNSVLRESRAILEDIEAHHKFLIVLAAKDGRRARWRK